MAEAARVLEMCSRQAAAPGHLALARAVVPREQAQPVCPFLRTFPSAFHIGLQPGEVLVHPGLCGGLVDAWLPHLETGLGLHLSSVSALSVH